MSQKLFTRNFILLMFGQVSSLIGNYTLKFALSMYILEKTGSAAVFGTIMAIAMIPTILLAPFGGFMADRFNRRNMMAALDFISGVCVLAAFMLFQNSHTILLIAVLQIVLSVFGAFETPTVQASVSQIHSGKNLLKANAAVNQVQAAAALITPFTGSLFYTAFGIRPVLAVTSVCFFITAFLECFIKLECVKTHKESKVISIIKDDFKESIRFLKSDQPKIFKLLLLASGISFFIIGISVVGLPYLVRNVLSLSSNHYGIAESIIGIGAIAGSILAGIMSSKLSVSKLHILTLVLGVCIIPSALAFFMPVDTMLKYIILIASFFAGQMICAMFSIISLSTIQQNTPQYLTGKVMAFVMTISTCTHPLGQIVYGLLFDIFSADSWLVLLLTGFIICAAGCTTAPFFKKFYCNNTL